MAENKCISLKLCSPLAVEIVELFHPILLITGSKGARLEAKTTRVLDIQVEYLRRFLVLFGMVFVG